MKQNECRVNACKKNVYSYKETSKLKNEVQDKLDRYIRRKDRPAGGREGEGAGNQGERGRRPVGQPETVSEEKVGKGGGALGRGGESGLTGGQPVVATQPGGAHQPAAGSRMKERFRPREKSDRNGMAMKQGEKSDCNGLVVKQEEKSNGPGGKQETGSAEQWMAALGPPAVPGTRFPNGSTLPATTIQPGLLRNPAATTLQSTLSLQETPILAEVHTPDRPAFVRAGVERGRTILFCLGDTGNLVQEDVMSVKTFNDLNRHASPPYTLEPFHGNIYAVNGQLLKAKGVLKEGILLHFEGASTAIRVHPVVCSDFRGTHINISQRTLGDHVISYHPTPAGGSWRMQTGEKVPLVVKKPPLYSVKYGDDVLKRISVWRLKNGFLKKKVGRTEMGEMSGGGGVTEEEGMGALVVENQMLKGATKTHPLVLTGDGFLARKKGSGGEGMGGSEKMHMNPLEDAFVGHEELRGLTVEELTERFEGGNEEVSHLKYLPEGRPMFLAPQVGRLAHDLNLASGEARTVVVRATLPANSYVVAAPLNDDGEASPEHLKGCVLSPSLTLCFNGKTALVVVTNGSFGPVTLRANSPVCQLSVVRPEFERQVLHEQQQPERRSSKMWSSASSTRSAFPHGSDCPTKKDKSEVLGEIIRRASVPAMEEMVEEDQAGLAEELSPLLVLPMEESEQDGEVGDEEEEVEGQQNEEEEDGDTIFLSSGGDVYTLEDDEESTNHDHHDDIFWSTDEEAEGDDENVNGDCPDDVFWSSDEEGAEEEKRYCDGLGRGPGEDHAEDHAEDHEEERYCEGLGRGPGEDHAESRKISGRCKAKRGKPSLELAMESPWTSERWRFGRLVGSESEGSDEEPDQPVPPINLADMSNEQRREHLARELGLDTNPILLASPSHLDRLKGMVANYHHIFTDGKTYNHVDVPACPYVQCRVVLDPNKGPHTPYRATPRPMSPIQRKALRDKLEQWRKQGVIEPSASPWSFPLVAVEKKRRPGQEFPEYRYCVDLRILNDLVYKDSCFSGSVPANLALLEGHKYYASMDLFSSFESIEIAPESRDFFSFSGADGEHWRMKRMTMGYCNSPGIMSRVTSMVLQGLPTSSRQAEEELGLGSSQLTLNPKLKGGGALGYIDDLLVFDMTLDGLLSWLEELFERISKARCLVKTSKACLVREEVDYLGFVVGRHGRKMQPAYRESVVNWPVPQKKQHLASFIGRTSYYREFIKNFSHLTHSLNQAKTRPEAGWALSDEETQDFHRLQEAFVHSEALSFPCFNDLASNPFILDLDFSQKGLSASLHQRQKCEDGVWRERLIGNISRKAPSALAISSSHRGEIAAAVMGVQHFRHLLLLAEFVMRSDSLSVRFIKHLKDLRGCFPRYFEILAHFRFKSIHRAGILNGQDDQMSRASHILPPMTDDEMEIHVPPSVGEMEDPLAGWNSQKAELMAGWEDKERRWEPRVNTTVSARSLARYDSTSVDTIGQHWETHPMLGYLTKVRLENEEGKRDQQEEIGEDGEGAEGDEGGAGRLEGDAGFGTEGVEEGDPEWGPWAASTRSTRLTPTSLFASPSSPSKSSDKSQSWIAGLSVADLVEMQRQDANLNIVRQWVKDNQGPGRTQMRQARADRELWCYRQLLPLISLEGDLLVVQRMRGQMTRSHRLLVPRKARLRMVATAHEQYCKHQGSDSTLWSLHTGCFWPGQARDVTDYVATCGSCWSKRYPPAKHQSYEKFSRTAGYVGQMVAADLIGPLPESSEGSFRYCLTALDLFSRYLYLVPLKNKKAETVASGFEWGVVARGGGIEAVYTDRGTEWLNHTFSKVCDHLAVRHTYTLPYSPSANGALERVHRTIKTLVRACLKAGTSEGWVSVAKGVVAAYNTTTNPATGLTPFFLLHGRECALPLTHFVVPPKGGAAAKLNSRDRWMQIGRQMTLYFLQQRIGMEVVQRRISHQGAGAHPLYPLHRHMGAEVVACLPTLTRKYSKTFAPRYLGPYFIIEVHSNVVATIRSDFYAKTGQPEREHTVGIDRLLPVPAGTRWEDGGVNLPSWLGKSYQEQREQQWASVDLHAEILKGAAPDIELAKLGRDPSDLDHLWEQCGDPSDPDPEEVAEQSLPFGQVNEAAGGGEGEEKGEEGGGGGGGGTTGWEAAPAQEAPTFSKHPSSGSTFTMPLEGQIIVETENEQEDLQQDADGRQSRRRRRSRSRSVVSIEARVRQPAISGQHASTSSSGWQTPPRTPAGGWMPTPPRDSREEEEPLALSPGSLQEGAEQVLRALRAGAEPDIIPGLETTPAGSNPVSAQATQPEAASVLEDAGTGQAEHGETPSSVAPSRGERVESHHVRPPDHSHQEGVLPPRKAKSKAYQVFSDPAVQRTLWGREDEGGKKRRGKKTK